MIGVKLSSTDNSSGKLNWKIQISFKMDSYDSYNITINYQRFIQAFLYWFYNKFQAYPMIKQATIVFNFLLINNTFSSVMEVTIILIRFY